MVIIDAQHAFGTFVEGGKDESFVATMRALHEKSPLAGGLDAWLEGVAGDPDAETLANGEAADGEAADAWHLADDLLLDGWPGDEAALAARDSRPGRSGAGGGRREAHMARRWRQGVLEHLEVMLATRSLELRDARRQLTYYVVALDAVARAEHQGGSWTYVHMLMEEAGQARPDAFHAVFDRALRHHPAIRVEAERLRFADGFELRFLRLPLLDALLEYLLTAPDLGDAVMALHDGLLLELATVPADGRERLIQDATNRLGQLLDGHLDQVVRTRDALDRYRRITGLVGAHSPPDQLVFDDETLLRFWQAAARAPEQHGDYRLFQTAFVHFARLARELAAARQTALYRREAAGLEAADTSESGFADFIERAEPSLDAFAEDGDFAPLKLLNKAECRELALLVTIGRVALAFGRSLLRGSTFGPVQNQMREAKRKRDHALLDRLASLATVPEDAYDGVRAGLAAHAAHLETLFLAGLDVAEHHHPGFLARGLAGLDDSVAGLGAALGTDPEALLKRARAAFASIKRAGFRHAKADPALGALYIEAVPVLCELASLVDGALGAIDELARDATPAHHLAADRPPFRATLEHLKEN